MQHSFKLEANQYTRYYLQKVKSSRGKFESIKKFFKKTDDGKTQTTFKQALHIGKHKPAMKDFVAKSQSKTSAKTKTVSPSAKKEQKTQIK